MRGHQRRGGALIVDGTEVGRQLLTVLLTPRFGRVESLADSNDALAILERQDPFDVLIVDLDADGGALALVEKVLAFAPPRPAVLVTVRESDLELETRLTLLGAIGFLRRPFSATELFRTLRGLERASFVPVAPRGLLAPGDVLAEALDPLSGDPIMRWEIRDLSRSGALLFTHGPLVVGERLRLRICSDSDALEVDADVVRVQAPDWGVLPGVAVRFVGMRAQDAERLDRIRARGSERQ